jgi:transposase InsO family protein
MRRVIQFESHRIELAIVYELEHDPNVLEYFDQPCRIPLSYVSSRGRKVRAIHTPDFFVLRTDSAGWEECKSDGDLEKLSEKNPHRYGRACDQPWRCEPGEEYATSLGLYYRLRTSGQIDWVFQRNILFLDDYLRAEGLGCDSQARELTMACVSKNPGILLEDMFGMLGGPTSRDCIFSMIAQGEIYVDLKVAPLVDPGKVHVFCDRQSAENHVREVDVGPTSPGLRATISDLKVGDSFQWDGKAWKVANAGESMISLLDMNQSFTEVPVAAMEQLVREGRVVLSKAGASHRIKEASQARLAGASEHDLRVANERFAALESHLNGNGGQNVPTRTLRSWAARFREAEAAFGDGYLGLLPRIRDRGNHQARLPEPAQALMAEFIENNFETLKQKSKYSSWISLKHVCEERGIVAPSYRAFRRALRKRDRFSQTLKRKGRRAAYAYEPIFWDLEMKTPRHGDRPFEIGHIDHTELDVEVRSLATGRALGRPWMTLLVDAFSRRIFGLHLTFDPPSYRSCMMVLRDCVRRHGRLPQTAFVDGGTEFKSTYFETLLARYACTKKTRPPAKPRFGSVCERLFGTVNTQFIYNLRGNTQMTRNVRQVTKSVDPRSMATWSLRELNERLDEYLFQVYDRMEHPALGQSPQEAFAMGLEMCGFRPERTIRYGRDFLICTMPTTTKGTAKISPGRGVKINHIYYWSDTFRDPEFEQRQLAVRYDPFDAGTAYAFCRNQWVECHSEYYTAFRGRSEREVMLATKELHKQHQQHSQQRFNLNARTLAIFLESVEGEETLLVQRLRDRETVRMREGSCAPAPACADGADFPTADKDDRLSAADVPPEVYGEF